MDRRNGRIYFFISVLMYLAAPVVYVGVIQAALCDRLGAGEKMANLPLATYLAGQIVPFFFSWLVPHRLERAAVVWSSWIWTAVLTLVLLTLVTNQPAWVRLWAVSMGGLFQGIAASVAQIFSFQCLSRGTTIAGRAHALKWSFSIGPIAAIASSTAAQFILDHNHHNKNAGTGLLLDFGLIYLLSVPCIAGMAWLAGLWELPPLADEPRQPFSRFLGTSLRGYAASRSLVLLFLASLLMNCTAAAISDFSLHTQQAMGQDSQSVAGVILILRFACKAGGGYILGLLAVRLGFRAAVIACVLFLAAAAAWAGLTTGPVYLLTFGFFGVGELAWVYLPTYVIALSPVEAVPRNLSILGLGVPAASFAPVLLGALSERFGFTASVLFALGASVIALALVLMIRLGSTRPQ